MVKLLGKSGKKTPHTARTIATSQLQRQIYRSLILPLAVDELKSE
jgi:hypothetical protein